MQPSTPAYSYVGSESCRDCHRKVHDLWATSTHARALRRVDAVFVSRYLTPPTSPVDVDGVPWQVELREGSVTMIPPAPPSPAPAAGFQAYYAVGGTNVVFFLTRLESDRWQVLPLAYELRSARWFDAMGSMLRPHAGVPDRPLKWTDPAFNWNAACANCHLSRPEAPPSPWPSSRDGVRSGPGIHCEACHGPAGRHVATARAVRNRDTLPEIHLVRPRLLSPQRRNALCASCHALAADWTAAFRPGDHLADHYQLVGLEHDDFFPDGRSRGETYTYTSFLLSKCVSDGELTCSHCHTPSGRLRWTGTETDRMCAPCHAPILDNLAAHTHHASQGEGPGCAACHMPEHSFARFRRHEHSLLPPAPVLSSRFGSPNACNACHPDRDAAWADQWVRRWYPGDYQAPLLHRAELVASARKRRRDRVPAIARFIYDRSRNQVFRASLIRLLGRYPDHGPWPALIALLEDPSPWVRAAAAEALSACPLPEARHALAVRATDTYRVVRLQAALALSAHSLAGLSEDRRVAVERVFREFETLCAQRPDHPAWQVNLGIYHQNRGHLARATAAYERALGLRPGDPAALVNLSRVYAAQDRPADSERVLLEALRADRENTAAGFNLGLLYGQTGRLDQAERALRRVLRTDPSHAAAAFNLAVILGQQSRYPEALLYARQAAAIQPNDPRYREAVTYYESRSSKGP